MAFHISASRHTALAFLLGAILVGGVLGFTADRFVTDRSIPWGWNPGTDPRVMRKRFAHELHLSSSQQVLVDSIIGSKRHAVDALMQPIRPKLDSLDNATATQIKAVLNDDQQARFDEMHKQYEQMKQQRRQLLQQGGM